MNIIKQINYPICELILNRPEKNNALNAELIDQLIQELDNINQDNKIQVLILKAAGKNFCAGADLAAMKNLDAKKLATLFYKLYNLNQITIVIAQGSVYGGGLGLIAACDFAFGFANAKFCFSEVKLGLIPAIISPYIINLCGIRNTKQYMLTAEVFSAQAAVTMGLLNNIIIDYQFAQNFAKTILANKPEAVKTCKKLIHKLIDLTPDQIDYTAELLAQVRSGPEAQAGINNFLNKHE